MRPASEHAGARERQHASAPRRAPVTLALIGCAIGFGLAGLSALMILGAPS